MPTYEYECGKCDLVFEHFQSMNDEPLKTCIHPEGCQHPKSKARVKRLLGTGAGIIFKGSGFYETDYRSSEYHKAAKQEKEGDSKSSSTKEEKKSTNGSADKKESKKSESTASDK